jgi:dynein heavy chain
MQVPEAERLGEEVALEARVKLLIDTTSYISFAYVSQGLFERHKLIVATQLCISILKGEGRLQTAKFEYLLKGPKVSGMDNPLREFVSDPVWASVMALRDLDEYSSLPDDLQGSAKRCVCCCGCCSAEKSVSHTPCNDQTDARGSADAGRLLA